MERKFVTISVELREEERGFAIEKFRQYLLSKGFIVEREWESQIDLVRPLPVKSTKEEIYSYPGIEKIQVTLSGNFIEFRCELYKIYQYPFRLILASILFDIIFLVVLFFLVKNTLLLIAVAGMMLTAIVTITVLVYHIPQISLKNLAEDIQSVLAETTI